MSQGFHTCWALSLLRDNTRHMIPADLGVREIVREELIVHYCIKRSYTVSPLIEGERNAPYVEIPSHDDYNKRHLQGVAGILCGTQQISVDLA